MTTRTSMTNDPSSPPAAIDPVVARRRKVGRIASMGKRLGYGGYLVAIVVFFIGVLVEWNTTVTTTVVVAMAIGSAFLLPAILLGYAVRSADKEDRARAAAPR